MTFGRKPPPKKEPEKQVEWMSFLSAKQLASWLLGSNQGLAFLEWFIRKYHRAIMATPVGAKIEGWIRGEIEKDDERLGLVRNKIVVERFPDGLVKVYAEKSDVVFIHRLKVDSIEGEILDEELADLNCPERYREVYHGRLAGMDFYTGRTPSREAARLTRIELSQTITAAAKRRDNPSDDRGDSESGIGDDGIGDHRGCDTDEDQNQGMGGDEL